MAPSIGDTSPFPLFRFIRAVFLVPAFGLVLFGSSTAGPLDDYQGYWSNQDPDAQGIARLYIRGDRVQGVDKRCGLVRDLPEVTAIICQRECPEGGQTSAAALEAVFSGTDEEIKVIISHSSGPGRLKIGVMRRPTSEATKNWTWAEAELVKLEAMGEGADGLLPAFPWPPPKASARAFLRKDLVVGNNAADDLGKAFDRIVTVLQKAGFSSSEYSVYSIPTQRGFVVVTKIENIDETGHFIPKPHRFSADEPPASRPRTLLEYLKALFNAPPGRFRFIALAVTDLVVTEGPVAPDAHQLEKALREGGKFLPSELRQIRLGSDRHCEALVYEFVRPSSAAEEPRFVPSSNLSAEQHLAGATILRTHP